MDDQVRQAMARWPSVPAMYGWLRLDRRGLWYLIDRGRAGFNEGSDGLGSPITSPPILDFINRNYEADPQGRWYWQNGPQRVFVDLDLAPLILRVFSGAAVLGLVTHGGEPVRAISQVACTEAGDLWLLTEHGPAVLHDLDLAQVELTFDDTSGRANLLRLNQQHWPIDFVAQPDQVPAWAQFVARPRMANTSRP